MNCSMTPGRLEHRPPRTYQIYENKWYQRAGVWDVSESCWTNMAEHRVDHLPRVRNIGPQPRSRGAKFTMFCAW